MLKLEMPSGWGFREDQRRDPLSVQGGRTRTCRGRRCLQRHDIDQRLSKFGAAWTNRQVERMNRVIKNATVKCYHYVTHGQDDAQVAACIAAYDYARRLKALQGLTPFDYICKIGTKRPRPIQF